MKKTRSFIFILIMLFTTTAFKKKAGMVPVESEVESAPELHNVSQAGDFVNDPPDNVIIRLICRDDAPSAGVATFCTESGTLTRLVTLRDEGSENASPVKRTFQKARINEVLISYLATGYEIQGTENGPRGDEQGIFMTYSLQRI